MLHTDRFLRPHSMPFSQEDNLPFLATIQKILKIDYLN